MNAPALPAYLQNRQSQGVAARATAGMGGVLPPHISRAGNSFTLIDAAGAKQPLGTVMRACVVDIADVMQKIYYEEDWKQGSDQPPDCYSRNGITPSQDALHKQSPTCSQCEWNVRGSDVSRISGKAIKACRDQKEIALLLPQYPTMLFQLVIPPGSFKNWASFVQPFLKGGVDISDVLVEFGFLPGANGVMTFGAVAYIDEATFAVREQALTAKATDVLVGRNDVPIALPAPQPNQNPGLQTTQNPQAAPTDGANTVFGGAPQAQVPFGASQAAPVQNAGAFGQPAQPPAQPAATPQTDKPARTRRTREQIAADNAAKAAAQAGGSPPGQTTVQPQAPFPVNQPGGAQFNPTPTMAAPAGSFGGGAAQQVPFGSGALAAAVTTAQNPSASNSAPAGNTGSFGIQNGADPNVDPALAEMLRGLGQ